MPRLQLPQNQCVGEQVETTANGRPPCFANYCDWRIPNIRELQGIIDYEKQNPAVDAAFHKAATCTGCDVLRDEACSCTGSGGYRSSTANRGNSNAAWYVNFDNGEIDTDRMVFSKRVRAVRGGL